MILTENWVRNKLRYWSILHLSIYTITSVALITATVQEFIEIWIFLLAGVFQLFLICIEICYQAGLSYRNTRMITLWQNTFIGIIGLISFCVIIGLINAVPGLFLYYSRVITIKLTPITSVINIFLHT